MADLAVVMDALADAVATVPNLRAFPYYADRVVPPAAIVGWPEEFTFDTGMGRGSDRCQIPLIVVVGRTDARSSRDALAKYVAGAGPASVKAAVESFETDAWSSVRVAGVEFAAIEIAGTPFLSCTFTIDIALVGDEEVA